MRQLHIIAWDAAKNQLMAQYLFSPQLSIDGIKSP